MPRFATRGSRNDNLGMVQAWYRHGAGMVQAWYQAWYRHGTGMVQAWCRHGTGMVQAWYQILGMVPVIIFFYLGLKK